MKINHESNPFGEQVHHFIEAKEGNFSVCIDVTGGKIKAKKFAEALRDCLKGLLKQGDKDAQAD